MPSLYSERILIIEDESLIRFSLRSRLTKEGYKVAEAETGGAGIAQVAEFKPDLVLLDFRLPDTDGISVLREVVAQHPEVVVILMTAHSTVESVVEAMKLGAYNYLNKPFDMDELVLHIQKGLETTALRREVARLRERQGDTAGMPTLVAQSPVMKEILDTIIKVNHVGSTTILLRGENGTGKDVLARYIHHASSRSSRPFMNITCTALPDQLLESELFGHERGAFTDAKQQKKGLLELADGGTVFLDEIGDMSMTLQAKLLRFLEERTFRRVGGTEDIKVNVRIIAATNRDLEQAVQSGSFRQDLFYRLAVIPITVPPLRERKEDIIPLARLFIDRYNAEFKRHMNGITDAAVPILESHQWPGNVRELRNVIERTMILSNNNKLDVSDLPPELRRAGGGHAAIAGGPQVPGGPMFRLPEDGIVLEDVERDFVVQALERVHHNRTRAAKLLGLTRDQIRYRLEKFHLEDAKKGADE